MFLSECCLSQLPYISTTNLNDHISVECISVCENLRLAKWSVSGVERIQYLCLAQISSITSYLNPPIPQALVLLHHQCHSWTTTCCTSLRGPAPSGDSLTALTPQAWSVLCKLLRPSPPVIKNHWVCLYAHYIQYPSYGISCLHVWTCKYSGLWWF